MKKFLSFILALVIVALSASVLSSCGDDESSVPDGMQLACDENTTDYLFYVPTTWKCDVKSGASTAYYSSSDTSSVSVMSFELNNADSNVDDWWKSFKSDFERVYENFKLEEDKKAVLDGVEAHRYVFTGSLSHDNGSGEADSADFKFMQVAAMRTQGLSRPQVYVFTYTSNPENYDSHLEDVESMLSFFKFN